MSVQCWLWPHAISLLHKFVLVVLLLRAFIPHLVFVVYVAVRTLPGLVDYNPMQFHCCINLYWLYHCCWHLLPVLPFFCVCGSLHFTWLCWLWPHAISLLHKFVLVVSLLRAFTPHFAFAGCVAAYILPGFVDYDPMHFHCRINLYWLYHCCVHLFPSLFLLCVWLFALYLAWLTTTPCNFIAA